MAFVNLDRPPDLLQKFETLDVERAQALTTPHRPSPLNPSFATQSLKQPIAHVENSVSPVGNMHPHMNHSRSPSSQGFDAHERSSETASPVSSNTNTQVPFQLVPNSDFDKFPVSDYTGIYDQNVNTGIAFDFNQAALGGFQQLGTDNYTLSQGSTMGLDWSDHHVLSNGSHHTGQGSVKEASSEGSRRSMVKAEGF